MPTPPAKRPERLRLPFMKRRTDPVTWIHRHRAGVFAVLALVLTMAILFVGSKIVVRTPSHEDAILVELQNLEELKTQAEELRREVMQRRSEADGDYIRNAISNEGADPGDTRGQRPRPSGQMDANRAAWDKGLSEIDAMGRSKDDPSANTNKDTRARGRVMISFVLVDPVRYSAVLVNPGFTCERGGVVVVRIVVDRNGLVTQADVDKGASSGDGCMYSAAVAAARASSFNVDPRAPVRQPGSITYTFIPQ